MFILDFGVIIRLSQRTFFSGFLNCRCWRHVIISPGRPWCHRRRRCERCLAASILWGSATLGMEQTPLKKYRSFDAVHSKLAYLTPLLTAPVPKNAGHPTCPLPNTRNPPFRKKTVGRIQHHHPEEPQVKPSASSILFPPLIFMV